MGRIVYSISGDGRGHATRAQAVIDLLSPHHEVLVLAPHGAYGLLAEGLSDQSKVCLRRLPAIESSNCGFGSPYSLTHELTVPLRCRSDFRELCDMLSTWQADLAICGSEPMLPRAAYRLGIPVVSLDHQHFLTAMNLDCLPTSLRLRAQWARRIVGLRFARPVTQIISSFWRYPLRRCSDRILTVGTLMRRQVLEAKPESGGHLVAYFRRQIPQGIEAALASLRIPVHVFGVGVQPHRGHLSYFPTSVNHFLEELRTCRAIVCTAGSQLIGESLHLRKPIFAIPESGNLEQALNAHFLAGIRGGLVCSRRRAMKRHLSQFARQIDELRESIQRRDDCGNKLAAQAINEVLRTPLSDELSTAAGLTRDDARQRNQIQAFAAIGNTPETFI